MRSLNAPWFDPPWRGMRYAKPHFVPRTPGDLFIGQPDSSEEGKRLRRHYRRAVAPFWTCSDDPMLLEGVGIGETWREAWADWRARLPWWRRLALWWRERMRPKPANYRSPLSAGYVPVHGPTGPIKPPPRKP